ncbi:ribonuclease P protein component 4 [Methanocella paludicola SANAE]|uniref:Ribonuclease P protein component 4 n=1 Tax=Methanocella paludicola (strain DSM 17711 / JCM 13418 / NBRC 101707 / SANAE) TaxID=304371 RepID=D1YVA4_METPS|nr:ribonuclease P protein component 4 [Methanocella paludicola]BAI60376.1 ribonuclease P protein component 4 [Methanocella paludicola SANAE]
MPERRRKEPQRKPFNVDMAEQRIKRLFELAEQAYPGRPDLADRYADIARRISMRHRVGIPRELKRRVCKGCGSFLVPGDNCRVRLDGNNIVITCMKCGAIKRYPYR